jgi:uncharacterized protein YjbI with pentapeptide repeats
MKIVKPLTLGLLHRPYRHRGRHHLSIAALGFFRLGATTTRLLTENVQWAKVMQALPPGVPFDEVMPRQRGEALLAGQAFAPGGKPVTEMCVRMCVGGIDKRVHVYGERTWRYGLYPRHVVSRPQPFVAMPLVYERAYGGPGHPGNPAGCGHTGAWLGGLGKQQAGPMPNLEYPGEPVRSHLTRYRPACFGPVDMRWAPRCKRHGHFDKRWLKEDAPGLARDVDWALFNTAPEDQWLDGFFNGGECYRLEGVDPDKPVIEGTLPQLQARAFVLREGSAADGMDEVPLRLDTVWFFPEHGLGAIIFHGETGITDSDALDVAAVMVAYEHAGRPKTLEHYREVLALRLDPAQAALHAFNESQLAPEHSAEELAARARRRQQDRDADQARQQAILDEMEADHWTASGMQPPDGYQPPRPPAPLIEPLAQLDVEDGDFDLSGMLAQARTVGERMRQQGEEKIARLLENVPAAVPPDPAEVLAEALDRARVPAPDLLAASAAPAVATDPAIEALMTAIDSLGDAVEPAQAAEVRAALAQLPALRRRSRAAAIEPAFPKQPLPGEQAALLGAQIRHWHLGGALLAGRDMAGASLRGADFAGADLREALLERADLSGASFAGADLRGAVFAGAILDGTDFSGARLAGANFCNSRGKGIRLAHADLTDARAIKAQWPQADLRAALLERWIALDIDLTGAALDGARLAFAMLPNASADGSSWSGAYLEKTVLLQASLAGADFNGATLVKAVLMDAALSGSTWRGARLAGIYGGGKADWSRAVLAGALAEACGFNGANFGHADLSGGTFLRCDFGNCNLANARLDDGLFSSSLFMRAVLRHASARRADLFQALCRKADFSCADLRGASLVQAECGDARFDGAMLAGLDLEPYRSLA